MKRSEIIDYIKSYAAKFVFGNLASYETLPTTADMVSTDIPAWGNITELSDETPVTITAYGQTYTYLGTLIHPKIRYVIFPTSGDHPGQEQPLFSNYAYDADSKIVTSLVDPTDNPVMLII